MVESGFNAQFVDYLNESLNAGITPIDLSTIMFENPCVLVPFSPNVNPKDVTFSGEAKRNLLNILAPELKRLRPEQEVPNAAAD